MKKSNVIKLTVFVLLISAVIWFVVSNGIQKGMDINSLRAYIRSCGKLAAVVFIGIFTLRTLFPVIPYSFMVVLGGSVFGPRFGFLFSMVAVAFSAAFAFYLSRFLGREVMEKFLHRGKLKDIGSKVEKHGFKMIFFMRISSIFHFDLLGFLAGMTKMKFRDYILATVIAMLPETFILNYLGNSIRHPFSPKFIIAVVAIVIMIALSIVIKKYYFDKNGETEN